MKDGLFRVDILLRDVIPRSTYRAPIITDGPVNIIKKPSVVKHIPMQPNDIVLTKMPGAFRNLSRMDPNIEIGIEISPKINGKMKNTEFS